MNLSEIKKRGLLISAGFDEYGAFYVRCTPESEGNCISIIDQTSNLPKGSEVIVDYNNFQVMLAEDESKTFPLKLFAVKMLKFPLGAWEYRFASLVDNPVKRIILPEYDYSLNPLLDNPSIKSCNRFLYSFYKIEVGYVHTQEEQFLSETDNANLLEYLKIFADNEFISAIRIITPLIEGGAIVKENYPEGIQIEYMTSNPEKAKEIFSSVLKELITTLEIFLPENSVGLPEFFEEVIKV